jgi:hypothetical protein
LSGFDVPCLLKRMNPFTAIPFFLLVLLASRAFGQSSFEEYLSTTAFLQHLEFETRLTGQKPARYQASAQPETWFFRTLNENGTLEVTGTSENRLWHVHKDQVVITGIPDPSTPIPKLTQGQLEFVFKKQVLGTGLSFGFQAAEVGSFEFDGDSFRANPRQMEHEPVQKGRVLGRVTSREGGAMKSLYYVSSVLPEVTNYVTFTYSTNVHPFLPSGVTVEFTMDGQRQTFETRYSSILLGITNTPAGGYVPSLWLDAPASSVLLYTNGNLYQITDGKPVFINLNPAGPPTEGGWVSPTSIAWFVGIAACIAVICIKLRKA